VRGGAPHLRRRRVVTAGCLLVLAVAVSVAVTVAAGGSAARRSSDPAVHVVGNSLVDANGRPLRLLGVSLSGPEYACIQGLGIFAGPTDARSIAAMKAWRINVVRVPLNEQCWLGTGASPAAYSGAQYRAAIRAYVSRLGAAGLYAILDLHWSAPGRSAAARGQQAMADLAHAPAFWTSVAREFKHDGAVLFDLYNEPRSISWACWRDGCKLPEGWRAAGMQTLLLAVRRAGADQPVIAAGADSGNDLSAWLRYRPRDPAHQLVAGLHAYDTQPCATVSCWNEEVRPVARAVPVIATEMGQGGCAHSYIDRFMSWADSEGISYVAWAWDPFGCAAPALIQSWDGQPTAYGKGFRGHLRRTRRAG
jgi:endoglucanase